MVALEMFGVLAQRTRMSLDVQPANVRDLSVNYLHVKPGVD